MIVAESTPDERRPGAQLHPTRETLPRREYGEFDAALIRLIDVCGALILLAILAPVLLMIMMAIVITDPGPAFFGHLRVGRDGRPFKCWKFRSMYVGAEERLAALLDDHPVLRAEWELSHKLTKDPRITPLGEVLRVTSLDELPQLINVLRGEMSLVGPRPIVSAEIRRYGRHIASYYLVKPGLTGLWQVSGRSDTTYRRRVAMDVVYVRSKSVTFDMWLLLATIPAVLTARGSH